FYLDGRRIEFRAMRWTAGSVRILLEEETREVPFGQIAELHMPRLDPWTTWFDQLAALVPDGAGFVMQIETGDGLRATASTARLAPATRGDGGNPDHWYHGVQPAWSLEPLWLKHRAIRLRRFFLPQEVPLTAIEPLRAIQKSNLAGGWSWQLDRNVQSGPLRCADRSFGWGFGVHAYSELAFDLPDAARVFRTHFGLDRLAGQGGCVRAAVFAGEPSTHPLYRSDALVGSSKVHETGRLPLDGASQLTLVVDPAHDDRPAGADPFEIRDTFDWLQPIVELDPEWLKSELRRRGTPAIVAWPAWKVVGDETHSCLVSLAWNAERPPSKRCRVEVAPREAFFKIARRLEFGQRDRLLALSVSRLERNTEPSRIQVRIGGRALAEFEVAVHAGPGDPDPLLVPIDRYSGTSVDVELVQIGSPQSRVEWRGIGLAQRDPLVFEALEDDSPMIEELTEGNGTAALETGDRFSGRASLRITPDDKNNPALPGWNLPVRSDPDPGEYRFVRFAWKKHGGKQIGLHLANSGAFADPLQNVPKESYRYHVGRGVKRDYGKSVQFRDSPPEQWELVTRDLFADFGPFDITGIRLVCGDGEWASFDHIYFARRPQDFDRIVHEREKAAIDPLAGLSADERSNVERIAVAPARFGEALGEVAPGFSTSASGQGVWLLKSYEGRAHVIRTSPPEPAKPCILRAPLEVPAGKRTELKLSVAHHPQSDWQLLVWASGRKLHDSLIASSATREGWAEISIDLSSFAGHNIVLELHNHPNNWSNEFAYWSRIEVTSE
ncbi:MAG TPA: NPCBM/NEW2 domain-containing protein, partial [Planctomycetaceae bacterium]|nr:NPCBM/NEW2 domain-containing protein [Planctomycetaceae bacterium]